MVQEPFSFETLSKHEALERKAPRLNTLAATFWQDMWSYLDQLETSYMKAHAENPTARRTILLSDELRNAMRKAEGLWEARQRKITFFAMRASRQEQAPRPENLSKEESSFYDELVNVFQDYHGRVFKAAARRGPAPTLAKGAQPAKPVEKKAAPRPAAAGAPPPATKPAASGLGGEGIATVRALEDIPPFVGLDAKTYRLKKGEIATIPIKMAEILRKNGKVAPVA